MKRYFNYLDLLRIISCLAVLFYHLGMLSGGYLAVCSFFVLSGYLSSYSAFKKEKFSFVKYYIDRLKKIYLPLVIVVFVSLFAVSFIKDFNFLNLKPETSSVLFGYNNFWQLSANLDYFARHISSPFMHLWYISILLQYEMIFPFIFVLLKKIGDKIHKAIPIVILFILSILLTLYFYYSVFNNNIMVTYYDSFSRLFSYVYGILFAFIQYYYGNLILDYFKSFKKKTFVLVFYFLILGFLFVISKADSNSLFFFISMVLSSLITLRIIDYATVSASLKKIKILNILSSLTYNIYLWQYPIIFVLGYLTFSKSIELLILFLSLLVLSYLLYFALNKHNKVYHVAFQVILLTFFLSCSGFGGYIYVVSKDHTQEMKRLEEELSKNEELIRKKQEEYNTKLESEKSSWEETIKKLEEDENALKDMVSNLPVLGIGDSVMLGAIPNLYEIFPNGYFDALKNRTTWEANKLLLSAKNNNRLGEIIIFGFGANGDCPYSCKVETFKTVGNRPVFWINASNDNEVHVNKNIEDFAKEYKNIHIIDWENISKGHKEYFVSDGIHLTYQGRQAYSKAIYDEIYKYYFELYQKEKDEIINNHNKELNKKISVYGNDAVLNLSKNINLDNIKYNVDDYNYLSLKSKIEQDLANNVINYNVIFVLDSRINISNKEFREIVNLLQDKKIYLVLLSDKYFKDSNDLKDITIIDFYNDIKNHKNYLMPDKIHLTDLANDNLSKIINEIFK